MIAVVATMLVVGWSEGDGNQPCSRILRLSVGGGRVAH